MKTINLFAATAMLIAAVACNSNKPAKTGDADSTGVAPVVENTVVAKNLLPSKSEIDSVSYLLGINFGSMIKGYNMGDLNFSEMKKGMNDFINAKGNQRDTDFVQQFKINPEEMNRIISEFIEKRNAYTAALNKEAQTNFFNEVKKKAGVVTSPTGLAYIIKEAGNDNKPGDQDTVYVHYKLSLKDGSVIEEVPENQPFSNGLMFPKDPQGAPEEIYNCRCGMVAIYPKYEDRSQPSYTEGMTIDGQSYHEWKKFDNYEDWKKWKLEQERIREEKKLNLTDKDIRSSAKSNGVSVKAVSMISKSFGKAFSKYEPLRNHIRELRFADNPGIASTSIDGRIITLDQKTFATEENMQNVFDELVRSGHSVNVDDPCFMIAHELGHCLESCAVLKQTGIGNGVIGTLQEAIISQKREELGLKYFENMGFSDETTEEIYGIIKEEMGVRALSSPSEMMAQAFGQVLYGTKKAPHAEKLVDYVLSLVR